MRDLAIADLNAAYDYYADTQTAWRLVRRYVDRGGRIRVRNRVTGNVTTEKELPDKAQLYVTEYLAAATFQQFVSFFEDFLFGVLRHWLMEYPQSLRAKQLDFQTVLNAPDKEALTLQVVNKELNEIAYKRPKDWFAYLEGRMRLGCPTTDEIDRLAEIKATRDIYIHNRGVASPIYTERAGDLKRCNAGEKLDLAGGVSPRKLATHPQGRH